MRAYSRYLICLCLAFGGCRTSTVKAPSGKAKLSSGDDPAMVKGGDPSGDEPVDPVDPAEPTKGGNGAPSVLGDIPNVSPTPVPTPNTNPVPAVTPAALSCPKSPSASFSEQGLAYEGVCWYLAPAISCEAECSDKGGVHPATRELIGSGGGVLAPSHCLAVMNLYEPLFTKALGTVYLSNRIFDIPATTPKGLGCAVQDTTRLASAHMPDFGMPVIREAEPTDFGLARSRFWRACGCVNKN